MSSCGVLGKYGKGEGIVYVMRLWMHGLRATAPQFRASTCTPTGATVGHIDRARDLLHRIDAGTAGPERVHPGHMAEQVGRPLLAL